ncbi:plasma protease C1 inhibitor [Danio aesculapii]|uniref:plasma protease C1 inhibitor n=1 Tax=Danio aesculapii TaxID=1142201 RepID=UPI0024BF2A89|nr:plasma protease C1 inhibitor [Danio aesculapii]
MYRVLLLFCVGLSLSSCDITVLLYSSISLPCVPDDAPALAGSTYIWNFTAPQTEQRTMSEKGKILTLRNVNSSYSGQYKCVQEGYRDEARVRRSRTFSLQVEDPPLLQEWQIIRIEAGYDAILPCKVSFSNETLSPSVVWKRVTGQGAVLLNPDKNTDVEDEKKDELSQRVFWDITREEQDWAIKISQTIKEDAGMYQCIITNTNQTLLVELEVEGPPPPRCEGYTDPWESCNDPDSRSWKAILQESLGEFSTSVYSRLKGSKAKTNLIFSPISIAAALSNLLLGARGETRMQLEEALGLPLGFSCLHTELKKLRGVMKDTLKMASAIFYDPEQQLAEAFVNQSQEFYEFVPQKLTNDSTRNVALINKWVENKTNKKITELIDNVDPSTSFVLLNAVYFNGRWKTVFESTNNKEKFTMFSGETKDVKTLYSSNYILQMGYNKQLKAVVGKFPLTGQNSLYILVPRTLSEESFLLMENNINRNTLEEMVSEMNKTPAQAAEVTLPAIKLIMTTQLDELLRNMGLSDLFNKPNLCGMFPGEPESFISDVRHRAFLSLTEKGVEAAAAHKHFFFSLLLFFSALQPFVLILWSDEAAAPLFMGRIINP